MQTAIIEDSHVAAILKQYSSALSVNSPELCCLSVSVFSLVYKLYLWEATHLDSHFLCVLFITTETCGHAVDLAELSGDFFRGCILLFHGI